MLRVTEATVIVLPNRSEPTNTSWNVPSFRRRSRLDQQSVSENTYHSLFRIHLSFTPRKHDIGPWPYHRQGHRSRKSERVTGYAGDYKRPAPSSAKNPIDSTLSLELPSIPTTEYNNNLLVSNSETRVRRTTTKSNKGLGFLSGFLTPAPKWPDISTPYDPVAPTHVTSNSS